MRIDRMKFGLMLVACLALAGSSSTSSLLGQEKELTTQKKREQTVARAITYLKEKGQDREDGSFSKQVSPGVTSLCLTAMLKNGVPQNDAAIQKGLAFVEGYVHGDGSICKPESTLKNYETSLAVMALVAANEKGKYDTTIANAVAFLKKLQWDDAEGHDRSSSFFGGQGYGSGKRPDASNTAFFIEALTAAGEDPQSEAMKNALTFMSRCQNLPNEENSAGFALKASDDDKGGFIYSPANNGESKAGETPDGGLRSYGSMTYTGLKSFLYAGVSADDLRVQAARDWIRRHYDLKTNPGMGEQGLFYYYHVFAKALAAVGETQLVDATGNKHDWRTELVNELATRQQPDGSWTNTADRWYEGDPNLVTAYVLMALSHLDDSDKEAETKK